MLVIHSCYQQTFAKPWNMERTESPYNVLLFITYGQVVYWVNETTVPLEGGDVLFIPAGSIRGGFSRAPGGHQRFATHFSIAGALHVLPLLASNTPCKVKAHSLDYFKQRFSLLNHHLMMKGPYQPTLCYAILLEMLTLVNHELDHTDISAHKFKLAEQIKKYILTHYREPVKLGDIAEQIERTPNYATNLFKEITGFSPIEYLHHVRIEKSKDLMFSTSMSLSEIADHTGFCDQAYFSRVFKKITGYSPSSYLSDKRG